MPNKNDQTTSPKFVQAHREHQYYAELNRVISVLFAGVLALMTFLLTVGVQRPHSNFSWALYSSIVVLALNLVAFVAGNLFHNEYLAAQTLPESDSQADEKSDSEEGKEKGKDVNAKLEAARRRLKVMRMIQQGLFIVGVGCVAWFAMTAANFFFSIPAAPTGPAQ